MHGSAAAGKAGPRQWGLNALLLALSLLVVYSGAELYVGYAIDDGMQFDLEMWRYSREAFAQELFRLFDSELIHGHS
jgi:hypothetical protein